MTPSPAPSLLHPASPRQLFVFIADSGWTSLLAAGDRPPGRSGHVAAYDEASDRLIVALGMDATEKLIADIWALDIASGSWACLAGEDRACARKPAPSPAGPSPRGFAAASQAGLFLFVFGGITTACAADGAAVPWPSKDLWALNIATVQWSRVVTDPLAADGGVGTAFGPSPRVMTSMVAYGRQDGLKNPLMLVGGADFDCFAKGCEFPTPLNDIWVIDAARAEAGRSEGDLAAEFDGNDVIEIILPKWCGLASSMSVLWIDAWVFLSSYPTAAGKPIMLIDSYADSSPVLRWYLEGASAAGSNGPGTYVVLVLISSLAESVTVKRWGPLSNNDLLQKWHHVAFTLRFARVSQQGSCNSPAVALVQAHMFLDTEPVSAGDSFLSLDIDAQLQLRAGITELWFGGVSPDATDASAFLNFVGAVDNLRIWWPPCPADNDPSRCNPYAFIYPVLQDGSRLPSSGISDDEVKLDHVARPLLNSILVDEVNSSMGLLVSLNFNTLSSSGILTDSSAWLGPAACCGGQLYSDACPGCPADCTFAFASQFDVSCLGSGLFSILEDSAAQEFYGNQGSCICLDIDTCPTMVQNCQCPQGLERVCTSCQKSNRPGPKTEAGVCGQGNATICWDDSDCGSNGAGTCVRLDPRFCPEELCSSWECACLLNGSSFALGQTASVVSGSAACSCPDGKSLQSMPLIVPGIGPRYPCCTNMYLKGGVCSEWTKSALGKRTVWTCISSNAQVRIDGTESCGVESCCIPSGITTGPVNPPGPSSPINPVGPPTSAGPTCTLTGLSQGTWIGTFVSATGGQSGSQRSINHGSVAGEGTISLRDVVFRGVFLPDKSDESVLENLPGQISHLKSGPLSKSTTYALPNRQVANSEELGTEVTEPVTKHETEHDVAKAAFLPNSRAEFFYDEVKFHSSSSRKLMQASNTAMLPVVVVMKLDVNEKSCPTNPLSCEQKSSIIGAIQTAAAGASGVQIQQKNILVSSVCDCSLTTQGGPGPINSGSAASGKITLNVSLVTDGETLQKKIENAHLISSNLNKSGINVVGLKVVISSTPIAVYCGDGIKQTQSSMVQVAVNAYYSEECDDGNSTHMGLYNSEYSRCTPACTCNKPGFKLDADNSTCVCQQNPAISLYSEESTSVQKAFNEIKLTLQFKDAYEFDYRKPPTYAAGPLIVTISGLQGSLTPDGTISVSCRLPDSSFACGLEPDLGSTTFRTNQAVWLQEAGELKFSVLQPFGPKHQHSSLDVKIVLQNNVYAQNAVQPSIGTCNSIQKPGTGYVLASDTVKIEGPKTDTTYITIQKRHVQGSLSQILNVSAKPFAKNTSFTFQAIQSSLAVQSLTERLPVGAHFAGLLGTAGLNYSFADHYTTDAAEVHIIMPLNRTIVRTQGGCVKSPDSHVKICLPGYVGLYQFKYSNTFPAMAAWESLTPINNYSKMLEDVEAIANATTIYAAIATSQCNDVRGSGRAGGDRICLTSADIQGHAVSNLGGLSVSRMPVLSRSTRPSFGSWAEYKAYINSSEIGSTYVSRTGWIRLCPGGAVVSTGRGECPSNSAAELSWFPARFGHSVAVVATGRVVIFGGYACQSADPRTSWCTGLTLLSDVWELDISVARNGGSGLKQIMITPSPPGAIGQVSIALPDNGQRILVFGGATLPYPFFSIRHTTLPPASDSEVFVVRNILLRIGTSNSGSVDTNGAKSFHSVVLTGSKAIIFGGFARNAPTSAAYMYDLDAVSPALGLTPLIAAASGPPARGFAGLAQMSEILLILFGGVTVSDAGVSCGLKSQAECCSTRAGVSDAWILDLNSKKWTTVPPAVGTPGMVTTAFGAFAHFAVGGSDILVLYGGIECGYLPGVTFYESCSIPSKEVECSNQVRDSVQIMGIEATSNGFQYSTWKHRKLTPSSSTPPARCMHSMLLGPFLSTVDVGLIYGGLDAGGRALDDFWIVRNDLLQTGECFSLPFNITPTKRELVLSDATGLLDVFSASPAGCSLDQRAGIFFGCALGSAGMFIEAGGLQVVIVTATNVQFQACIQPFFKDPEMFQRVAVRQNSTWGAANLITSHDPKTGYVTEIRFDMTQFQAVSPAQGCKTSCMGGFCQPLSGFSTSVPSRCYVGDADCGGNYTCSLPGRRHGHSMVTFSFAGRSMPLLFGGETTHVDSKSTGLSAELFSAFIDQGSASWVNLNLGYIGTDGAEHSCTTSDQMIGGLCPAPRRDAAVVLMGNTGGQNGRMLLFGGMTYCQPSAAARRTCSGSISPVLSYLTGSMSDAPTPLDDLWSLSLTRISLTCIRDGLCPSSTRLLWTRIPVAAGAGPSSRWGAGISMNRYTNELFLTGGATVDSTGSYSEQNELFSYLLTDAYYQSCVASGDGLQNALAGQQASFTVMCSDVFGQPAATASVFVHITGPVTLSPAITAVDGATGTYRCTYTAGTIGTYGLEIRVGRGGSSKRELIPSGQYVLTVLPGSTSPTESLSSGDFLSLSTAGAVGSFTILARDSLGNRRPGKDEIDVLIHLTSDTSVLPVPGQVNDIGDGSYQVQYSITMAGKYSLRISFSGIVGAQTPIELMVQSAATDLTRTYGYGTVLYSAAGVTSSLFVQTRDGYGNNALVDPELYPSGLEDITFELCKTIKDDPTRACAGGDQEMSISVTRAYGAGPSGSSDTAYGLYTLSYFPFSDGTFVPLVRHNNTVVACLFDTSGLPVAVDPGPAEADACILQNQIEAASSASRRSNMPRILSVPFQQSSRRLAAVGKVVMVVNATFKEPDLKNAKYWSLLAPILAAIVGVFFDLCCGFLIPSLRAKHKDNENKGPSMGENDDGKIESEVLESKSLQSQDHSGGLSYEGNESLPEPDSTVSARVCNGKIPSNDAGKESVVTFAKASPNSNLVFISEKGQPEDGLQSYAREASGIHQMPMLGHVSIPNDEQVWSLEPHPGTNGSGLDPWVSHVRRE